jgi:hypothetical protein
MATVSNGWNWAVVHKEPQVLKVLLVHQAVLQALLVQLVYKEFKVIQAVPQELLAFLEPQDHQAVPQVLLASQVT